MYNQLFKGYTTPQARWARFGSYYAMSPSEFALEVIDNYSQIGDFVLDPFAGRGTSIYATSALDRSGTGIEINPVGFIFAQTKLNPAKKENVIKKLLEIDKASQNHHYNLNLLPQFFRHCFCDEVLYFLLTAKDELDWINNNVDRTLMGFILASLHDNIGCGLSNQMRRTKSMSMEYSIKWWAKQGLSEPPRVDPCAMLLSKIDWRYKKGIPSNLQSVIHFGDSVNILDTLPAKKYSLMLTSPPYQGVTDYHNDQWLRLWMLDKRHQISSNIDQKKHQGRFANKADYQNLLNNVFEKSARLMQDNCVVYVRTDSREFTLKATEAALKAAFPEHTMTIIDKPIPEGKITQTQLFGTKPIKSGEIDIILQ